MLEVNFWKNKKIVKKTVAEKNFYEEIILSFNNSVNEVKNLKELYELSKQEKDEELLNDCDNKLEKLVNL